MAALALDRATLALALDDVAGSVAAVVARMAVVILCGRGFVFCSRGGYLRGTISYRVIGSYGRWFFFYDGGVHVSESVYIHTHSSMCFCAALLKI